MTKMRPTKARQLIDEKFVFDDGAIVQLKLWKVLSSVPGSDHYFKYSLYYGKDGQRLVGYDNERGKGDHIHYKSAEKPYNFIDEDRLIEDFISDVEALRR